MDPFVNFKAKALKSDGNINISCYDEPAGLYIKRARRKILEELYSLVVRALEWYSNDPGSSPGGDACFSH